MARYNVHLLTARRSYAWKEARGLFRINRETWLRWLASGLIPIKRDATPVLVLGSELKVFLANRRKMKKLDADQFYCTHCHCAVLARNGTETFAKTGKKIGKENCDQVIRAAECSLCGGRIWRFCPSRNQTNAGLNGLKERTTYMYPKAKSRVVSGTSQKNEVIKRRFYEFLKGPGRLSTSSVERYEGAIWRWEDFSQYADFSEFNQSAAVDFKEWLEAQKKNGSEKPLSVAYRYDVLRFLKRFFDWLSKQRGYRHLSSAVDYLNSSLAEARTVSAKNNNKEHPSIEEIKTTIESINGTTEEGMRDRAMFSLEFLTVARVSALMTLRMKSFDRSNLVLVQDPNDGVQTKKSKRIVSPLFATSYKREAVEIFLSWFDYLQNVRRFRPEDPIFPATKLEKGYENNVSYRNTGLVEPILWKSPATVRKIFKKRFAEAGIKYYHPHTFRYLRSHEISKLPLTEEEKKALSQSYGHSDINMTFEYYGQGSIPEDRQVEIIKGIDLSGNMKSLDLTEEERAVLARVSEKIKNAG